MGDKLNNLVGVDLSALGEFNPSRSWAKMRKLMKMKASAAKENMMLTMLDGIVDASKPRYLSKNRGYDTTGNNLGCMHTTMGEQGPRALILRLQSVLLKQLRRDDDDSSYGDPV